MAFFTVRAELLHGASETQYTRLHDLMRAKGWRREIADGSSGTKFHLPPAEYFGMSDMILADVRKAVTQIASQAWPLGVRILVSQVQDVAWYNLQPA